MKFFNRLTTQIFSILAISALISFSSNALRTDGLSLVYANESILQIEEPGGYVSIKEAALLALSNRAIFLDARSKQEFKQGHIQGAFSLPTEDFATFYKNIESELKKYELIITYCDGENCHLSDDLADQLIGIGVTNVQILKNGWTLWKRENLPIEQ